MRFADPVEREKVLGPLYSTAAKADVAVFGPERFTTKSVTAALHEEVKKALESAEDPVVDLLAPQDSALGARASTASAPESLGDDFTQVNLEPKESKRPFVAENSSSEPTLPTKTYSSQELYERSHYTAISRIPSSKTTRDQLDHVMLRRAINGYLFNPKTNKNVVTDDPWLQDVWEWIAGAEVAAQDDGMISAPLDLSYMGVYTIWMNLLGKETVFHSSFRY